MWRMGEEYRWTGRLYKVVRLTQVRLRPTFLQEIEDSMRFGFSLIPLLIDSP